MRILGIDPGLATVGYAVIEFINSDCKILEYGCIKTDANMAMPKRLALIYNNINEIIDDFNPTEMAIEELFFYKNVSSGILVGQARGAQILAGQLKGLEIFEYTPIQIKQAVTGYGHAEKKQVQETLRMLFNLKEIPKPDDAADAIGVAFTHAMSRKFKKNFMME